MRKLAVFAAVSLFVVPPGVAMADETVADEEEKPRASATLADLDWLVGHWAGTGIGGNAAGESFSWAGEAQMVGHFWQLDDQGGVQFYELITVTPDGDSLVMRLKHFAADLTGWEEKPGDTALEFPLRERSDTRWVFGPVTFTRPEPDRLDVQVLMRPGKDGTQNTLDFQYRRVVPGERPPGTAHTSVQAARAQPRFVDEDFDPFIGQLFLKRLAA